MKKYLKPAIGLLIVAYVLRSKIVDFEALREVALSPIPLAVGLSFQLLINAVLALRWYLLCRAQALPITMLRIGHIHWTSAFLSLVLPGAVGADLVKGWYVIGESVERKSVAALTIFVDRVVGSSILFVFSALSLVVFRDEVARQPQLHALARVVWSVCAALVVGGVAFLLLPPAWIRRLQDWEAFWSRLPLQPLARKVRVLVGKVLEAALGYRAKRAAVCGAATLSAINVLGNIAVYAIQGQLMGIPLATAHYLLIVPLSALASYFGFLPLGLGVGQVVFYQMFVWFGVERPETGAALCTLIQLHTLLFNLSGAVGFLKYRRARGTLTPTGALRRVS